MSTKKLAVTALLALAFFSQSSLAAMAEDSGNDDDSSSFVTPTGRPTAPAPFERKHGDRKDGDRKEHNDDGDFQVAVPPMVITPNDDADDDATKTGGAGLKGFKVAPPKGGSGVNSSVPDTAGNEQVIEPNSAAFDPTANQPIQMNQVHPSNKTPADVFIQSAQIGVGAMAAGAAVLGVAAAVRGQRTRRETKTDFIYEVEN
ncbi:MAG: hypothetical protein RL529_345 [Actinomycetota bacterium]|jgi:hypothetical protein